MNIERLGITPGPWEIEKTSVSPNHLDSLIKTSDDAKYIGWIYNDHSADARLIAAAPEMLEALIELCVFINPANDDIAIIAIERATGKTWEEVKEIIG